MAKPIAIAAHQAVLEIIARSTGPLAIDQIEASLSPSPKSCAWPSFSQPRPQLTLMFDMIQPDFNVGEHS